ncbi:hypothetical protein [Thiomonas arsenitoxydans]|uniref:hypothetical protein n=3 Tax=Thiomonas arsenitoxydans (strain DSM 22701 / CIP 110005 / 3As) TaxID=426114 RepID=UPI0018D3C6A8|nr:hypothetical protein [Thiomonas arsenitoxydans]
MDRRIQHAGSHSTAANPARVLMSSLSPTGAPDTQPAATIPLDVFAPPLCGPVVGTTRVEDVGTGEDLIEAVFSGWKLPGEFSKKRFPKKAAACTSKSLITKLFDSAVNSGGLLCTSKPQHNSAQVIGPNNRADSERHPLAADGPLLRALCGGFAGAAKYRVAIDVKARTP